jgi:5-methyltetrahydrofolate--homocysteine methyltransferase
MDFKSRLGKELLTFNGAMGTMLQNRGLAAGELPDVWNVTRADVVLDVQTAYVKAGCDILKTNTFCSDRLRLSEAGYTVDRVVSAGVEIARKAAGSGEAYVALDVGPTGKLLKPFGDLDFEAAVGIYAEIIVAGTKAGADLVLIETMSDTYDIKAAMLAAKENCGLPVLVTFTPDRAGKLLTGGDVPTAVCLIEGLGADALGFNCGLGPTQMKALLPELVKYASIPVIVNPNAGIPEQVDGKTVFRVAPEEFAAEMKEVAAYAQVIGGCCGTTPDHMAAMVKACRGVAPPPVTQKDRTVVSSYGKTVFLGGPDTVIIGERINPTGKPRMKQALLDGDMEHLYREGLDQADNGADILDVNVGLPGIDEREMLARVVAGLQGVTDAPLQIDTADPAAAERALRLYNGKPLLNSVSGKKESLETMLPLVKKYGAAVVALTLDDEGIPETARGRIKIAEKIIAAAKAHGIHRKDVIVDALTMTISTGGDNAMVTLSAIERVRRELGVHTVLGVSNVSFGLPGRETINAAFFALAMSRGLSAAIVNPMNSVMMDAFHTYRALSGADENCAGYIGRFSGQAEVVKTGNAADTMSLYDAVVSGLSEQAGRIADAMAEVTPPLEIISAHLIPALDKVGKDFEDNVIFLPRLLMSAESAKRAFEAIKLRMSVREEKHEKREKIVLATVKGDIHDIGKNIVKTLLENYNFQVVDLGKNVEPAHVAETVQSEQALLVGLSALMTTTVSYMEETIRLLREKTPHCRVMVGGAVLTKDYAAKIGADFYSKDAMGGVRYANKLFSQ